MARVITFGEIMLRLNPEGYYRLVQADKLEVSYTGAEANVAVALTQLGVDAAFVSTVPAHEVGQCAVNFLRRFGVDTSMVKRCGSRLGVFYVEKGASQRGSKVIYDRADSAITKMKRGDYDWDAIFEGADWFYWTGITPALHGELPEISEDACKAAKAHGVKIACDVNYREKLWTTEEAGVVMERLLPYSDLIIVNEDHARKILGITAEGANYGGDELLSDEQYTSIARQVCDRYGCSSAALTVRRSISANDNKFAAMLYADGKSYFSPEYRLNIVDRIGGGDAFAGGLLYGLIKGKTPQETLDFAVAAGALNHSIEHDFNLVSLEEIEAVAAGHADGRVQR
jgi:2-dehydro-3-deoxygluconokinase